MSFSESAEDILISFERHEVSRRKAIQLLCREVRQSIGDDETTLQGFPSQWKGKDADAMKKLWVNARNHLRRQIVNRL